MTYLTKEDWEKHYVQKICDDKSFSALINENLKIKSNFIFLINKLFNPKNKEALQNKKLLKELLFPSLNFFHKYTLSSGVSLSNLPYTEVLTLYITCIYLSLKTVNKLVHLEVISSRFQSLFNKDENTKYKIEDINDLIKNKEFEILLLIQFDINFDCPFRNNYLIKNYLTKIKQSEEMIKTIVKYVNTKISETIFFPLCLYFIPTEINISSLLLVAKENKLNFINIDELIKINNLDVDKNNIMECCTLMNRIIKYLSYLEEMKKKKMNINNNIQEDIHFGAIVTLQSNN
jgi:hypothetical protein